MNAKRAKERKENHIKGCFAAFAVFAFFVEHSQRNANEAERRLNAAFTGGSTLAL
jgi:hypothetical protein